MGFLAHLFSLLFWASRKAGSPGGETIPFARLITVSNLSIEREHVLTYKDSGAAKTAPLSVFTPVTALISSYVRPQPLGNLMAACAAASLAMGTRKGEQET